jgi:MFS family permease
VVACWGAGSAVAIVSTGLLARRIREWRLAAIGAAIHGGAAVALALAPSFALGLAAAFVLGIGYSLTFTVLTARLQDESEDRYRGRVMSLHTLSHLGMRPFNAFLAGAAAGLLGVQLAMGFLALLGPLALVGIAYAGRLRAGREPAAVPSSTG